MRVFRPHGRPGINGKFAIFRLARTSKAIIKVNCGVSGSSANKSSPAAYKYTTGAGPIDFRYVKP